MPAWEKPPALRVRGLERGAARELFLFRGRAAPQTGTQAYGLLRDIIAWRLQIADDDSIAVARQKMEDGIVPLLLHDDGPDLAEAHAHLLGHLIGIEWRESRHLREHQRRESELRRMSNERGDNEVVDAVKRAESVAPDSAASVAPVTKPSQRGSPCSSKYDSQATLGPTEPAGAGAGKCCPATADAAAAGRRGSSRPSALTAVTAAASAPLESP